MKIRRFLIVLLLVVLCIGNVFTPAFVSAKLAFVDVESSDYFYDAVNWAVSNRITNGTTDTTFTPSDPCTRGQAVTFLWRANESEIISGVKHPFTDVRTVDYYYDSVLWAYSNHITSGMTAKSFGPSEICNRSQIVTFLWRSEGMPESSGSVSFKDVPKDTYYYEAVRWAVEKGITKGTSDVTFSPGAPCTRGQIVTFLYRYYMGGSVSYPITVTAVGETAVLVEMLGGPGCLLASSQSFTSNQWDRTVFAGDIANVKTLWEGRGNKNISDKNFQKLLTLKPDICLINSGDCSFTDDQIEQLSKEGIQNVILPKLNNIDNLKSAVRLIGELLGDQSGNGGKNAPAIAEAYCEWADGIISKVDREVEAFRYNNIDFSKDRYMNRRDEMKETETKTGLYTLFISDWDEEASYRLYSGSYLTLNGRGVAIAPSGYSITPLSYYLSEAGIVNRAAVAEDGFELKNYYVKPLDPSTRILDINGNKGTIPSQFLTYINDPEAGKIYLGDPRFPAIVVSNNAVKAAIEQDRDSKKMWTVYPWVSAGQVGGYGFLEEQGQVVSTTIHGPYQIYVLPDGAGSWNYASAEGVLASMWAAVKYNGSFSEEVLRDEIAYLYESFYDYSLTNIQIDNILEGS